MEVLRLSNSSTITDKRDPIHPGVVLMEDFIEGFGIMQHKLAVSIGVPPRRINEIVHGKRAITADTALRLGRYFGIDLQFWLNLQAHFDLELAQDRAAEQIAAITPLKAAWLGSSRRTPIALLPGSSSGSTGQTMPTPPATSSTGRSAALRRASTIRRRSRPGPRAATSTWRHGMSAASEHGRS